MASSPPSSASAHFAHDRQDSAFNPQLVLPLGQTRMPSKESVMTTASVTVSTSQPKPWKPFFLSPTGTILTFSLLIGVAVGLEVALNRSQALGGFSAGPGGVALNQFLATQFAKSFIPAVLSLPLVFLIKKSNDQVRALAPYVELAKGGALAKKTLTISYVTSNSYIVALKSLRNGHLFVTFSSLVLILATFIQPLAASLFLVRASAVDFTTTAQGLRAIGLNPGSVTLEGFTSSAGFVDAAVLNNLTDPPLIHGGWTVPPYQIDNFQHYTSNSTLFLKSPAMRTQMQCMPASSLVYSNNGTNGGISVEASLSASNQGNSATTCSVSVAIDTPSINWQSGALAAPAACATILVPDLGNGYDASAVDFRPVALWLYSFSDQKSSFVFCQPIINAHQVVIEVEVASNAIQNVTIISDYAAANNVTGSPLNSRAFNGIAFQNATLDKFTLARSIVIPPMLGDAILSKAKSLPGGLEETLTNSSATVEITQELYTQYLAVSAASLYFVDTPVALSAVLRLFQLRLWMDPTITHLVAALLIISGVVLACIHTLHLRARKNLFIAGEPGSLASAAAVLSQSRFARALIRADQDNKTLENNLKGLRFGFDPKTWAIEAEGYKNDDFENYAQRDGRTPGNADFDQEQVGFLASQQMESVPYGSGFPPTPAPNSAGFPASPVSHDDPKV